MVEFKPPAWVPHEEYLFRKSLFLAGSIEMGLAVDWQQEVKTRLGDVDVSIFNPRRDDWDTTWVQSKENIQFSNQVRWELHHIHNADVVFFYFAPKTMSPISLLELGLLLGRNGEAEGDSGHQVKIIVVCPDEFWRKGNVDITSDVFEADVYDNLEDGILALRKHLTGV